MQGSHNNSKWLPGAIIAVVAIVVLAWLARSKDGSQVNGAALKNDSTTAKTETGGGGRSSQADTEHAVTPSHPSTVHLTARLIDGMGSRATISLGAIAPEDWVEINSQIKNFERTGKKPKLASDLARFAAPVPIQLSFDADNNAIVDLPTAAPAAVYRIDAIRLSDNAWYRARFVPAAGLLPDKASYDIGDIAPTLPTGVRITFRNAPEGLEDFELGLERRISAETTVRASELLDYVKTVRPDILDVLHGDTRFTLSASLVTTLAPLPPDPSIRLTFRTLTGVEGIPIDVVLKEQQIVDATVDLSKVFNNVSAGSVALRGRLLLGDTDRPIAGATIERENAPIAGLQTTGANGEFSFDGLPTGVICHFNATMPRADGARPLSPQQATFEYTAPADATSGQTVEWRVPAYQWLVLKMTKDQSGALTKLARQGGIGPPIFVLQRKGDAAWIDDAADEFIPEPDAMAVSMTTPGDYRVAVAANPIYTITSTEAHVEKDALETVVALPAISADSSSRTLTVFAPDGPLMKAGRVWINGPHRSVPPISMLIPPDGQIQLPASNAEMFNISVTGPGFDRIPATLPAAGTGALELRLPAQ